MGVLIGSKQMDRVWFSAVDSGKECHIWKSSYFCPYGHVFSYSVDGDIMISAHISGLLYWRRPLAIIGRIWAVAILAVKRMAFRLRSHGRNESIVIQESHINSDRGILSSVQMPILERWVAATADHSFPCIVQRPFLVKCYASICVTLLAFYVVSSVMANMDIIFGKFVTIAAVSTGLFKLWHTGSIPERQR